MIVALPGTASAQGATSKSSTTELVISGVSILISLAAIAWLWRGDVIRPGSFKRKPGAQVPRATSGLGLLALMLGCMVVSSLAQVIAAGAIGIDAEAGLTVRQMGIVNLVVGPVSLIAAVGAMVLAHRLDAIPRFRLAPKGFGLGLALAVVVLPMTQAASAVTIVIASALGHGPSDAIAHDTLDAILAPEAGVWKWVLIAGAVVVTPIVEEVLFRGLLQSALAALMPGRWGKWGAVLIASALFTLAHTTGGIEWHSLPAIGVLGLSMAIAYERTGLIAVPIAMHVAFNGANVLLAMSL